MSISEKFSAIRKHFGLTAVSLGEIAGISSTAIAKIESGETAHPKADVLAAISSKLRIDLNWLLLDEGKMLKGTDGISDANPNPTKKYIYKGQVDYELPILSPEQEKIERRINEAFHIGYAEGYKDRERSSAENSDSNPPDSNKDGDTSGQLSNNTDPITALTNTNHSDLVIQAQLDVLADMVGWLEALARGGDAGTRTRALRESMADHFQNMVFNREAEIRRRYL